MNKQKFWARAVLTLFILALGAEGYAATRQVTDPIKQRDAMAKQHSLRKAAAKRLKIKYAKVQHNKLFTASGTPKSGEAGGYTGKGKISSPKLGVKK